MLWDKGTLGFASYYTELSLAAAIARTAYLAAYRRQAEAAAGVHVQEAMSAPPAKQHSSRNCSTDTDGLVPLEHSTELSRSASSRQLSGQKALVKSFH